MSQRLGERCYFIVGMIFHAEDLIVIFIKNTTRKAKRFGKQIFLSVDVPTSFGGDAKLVLAMERGIVDALKEREPRP